MRFTGSYAMTGQDAVNVAENFNESLGIDGGFDEVRW